MNNTKALLFKMYEIGSVAFLIVVACFSLLALYSKYNTDSPFHLFSVISGSMTPELPVGTGVFVLKLPEYYVNDVITYTRGNQKVTHRIVFAGTYFLTKGDANKEIDQQTVNRADIIGKVMFSLPFVGSLQQSTKRLSGLIGLVIIPSILIIVHESIIVIREIKKLNFKFVRKNAEIGLGIITLFVCATLTTQVSAFYSDTYSDLQLSVTTADFASSPTPSPSAYPSISPSPTPTSDPSVSPSASPTITPSPSALPSSLCVNEGNGAGSVNICVNNTVDNTIINQVNNSAINTNISVNSNTGNSSAVNNSSIVTSSSSPTVLTIQVINTTNSNTSQ